MNSSLLRSRPSHLRTHVWLAGLLGALMLLGGCAYWPRATQVPIPTMRSPMTGERSETLIVFLPGRGDTMADFVERGMAEELAKAGVRADWVAVDSHLGYYRDRSIVRRLKADVIGPARAEGYHRIVVVGVSLGGLGGLLVERDTEGLANGLVLIAPYLGDDKKLFEQISASGGPAAWAKTREAHEPTNAELAEQLWVFIGQNFCRLPPTWLAYGTGDRLAGGHRLLAPLLPPERVKTVKGGHDWTAWKTLWRELCVDSDLFSTERATARK